VWASTDWTLRRALRTARFWWISLGYFCGLYIWCAVQVHQTKFLLDVGFSANVAVWALGVVSLLPVLAEQLFDHLVGEHSSVEQRLEDGIVQSLSRVPGHAVVVREAVGVVEAARQQEVGELREQLLEIEVVEILAGEPGVAVLQL